MNSKNLMKTKTMIFLALTAVLFAGYYVAPIKNQNVVILPAAALPPASFSPSEEDQLVAMHLAGLHNDRPQIPVMVAALQTRPHGAYNATILQALARMGATETLPVLDTLTQDSQDPALAEQAKVVKARLLAEAATQSFSNSTTQALAKINRFYKELGIVSDDSNTAVSAYKVQPGQSTQPNFSYVRSVPKESYIMEELADMTYHGSSGNYAHLPGVAEINFQLNPAAALKMRLASLPQPQRIRVLVDELASIHDFNALDRDKMQLVVDEGTTGSRVVAAKLQEMDVHQSLYSAEGFSALFEILGAIDDKSQALLVAHFKDEDQAAFSKGGVRKMFAANVVANTLSLTGSYRKLLVNGY